LTSKKINLIAYKEEEEVEMETDPNLQEEEVVEIKEVEMEIILEIVKEEDLVSINLILMVEEMVQQLVIINLELEELII
jgi:hypothetical protein